MKVEEKIQSLLDEVHTTLQAEMDECDKQIKHYQDRKDELQKQMGEGLAKLQPQKTTRRKDGPTIKELILQCLSENGGKATVFQIKKFLKNHGRGDSNPGVDLKRLLEDETIAKVERGIYAEMS